MRGWAAINITWDRTTAWTPRLMPTCLRVICCVLVMYVSSPLSSPASAMMTPACLFLHRVAVFGKRGWGCVFYLCCDVALCVPLKLWQWSRLIEHGPHVAGTAWIIHVLRGLCPCLVWRGPQTMCRGHTYTPSSRDRDAGTSCSQWLAHGQGLNDHLAVCDVCCYTNYSECFF